MNPGDEVWITAPDLARHIFRRAVLDAVLPDGSFILKTTQYLPKGGIGELLFATARAEPYQGQEEWLAPDGTRLFADPIRRVDYLVEKKIQPQRARQSAVLRGSDAEAGRGI